MPDANLKLIITAVDKASAAIGKITGAFKDAGKQISQAATKIPGVGAALDILQNPITGTASAVIGLGIAFNKAVNDTQKYALEMGDLSKVWGTSVEEASALVQVADDARVSQQALSSAMRIAMKQGIEPSIAGLKEAATTYQSFTNTQERAEWASKKFGRQWTEVARLLEMSPEQFDDSTAAARKFGLIIGDDTVAAAKEYYAALDDLGDAQEGFTIQVGSKLIPIWTKFIGLMGQGISTGMELGGMLGTIADLIHQRVDPAYAALVDSIELANSEAVKTASDAGIGALTESMRLNGDQADETAGQVANLAYQITNLSKATFAKEAIISLGKAVEAGEISAREYEIQMRYLMGGWLEMNQGAIEATIQLSKLNAADSAAGASAASHAANVLALYNRLHMLDGTVANTAIHQYTFLHEVKTTEAGNRRRQHGGSVVGGSAYLVGEAGPELFVPRQSGNIVPNNKLDFGEVVGAIAGLRKDFKQMPRMIRDQLLKGA